MELTDAELVARARDGDAGAFGALVERHLPAVYTIALARTGQPADADDVCQEAFLRALERLESCRHPERFGAWLHSIVRNLASNLNRSFARSRSVSWESLPEPEGGPDPVADAERSRIRDRLLEAVRGLAPERREVLLLHDLEGWTHAEIAASLGIPSGTARSHLHHARRAMRRELADLRGDS